MASHAATYKCDKNDYKGFKVLQIVFEDKPKQIQRKHIGKITGIESRNLSKAENIEYVKAESRGRLSPYISSFRQGL